MSFILDSLRKSENARQQNVGPNISEIGASNNQRANRPMFFWLAILLGINVVVLLLSLWRPWSSPDQPNNIVATPTVSTSPAPRSQPPRVQQQQSRPEVRPLSSEVAQRKKQTATASTPRQAASNDLRSQVTTKRETAPIVQSTNNQILPTIHELQSEGKLQLSELHLDMHMFHEDPNRRFIFLNSKKYKEGERISEGPLLEEIRNDAVVFYYKGQRFLLPR